MKLPIKIRVYGMPPYIIKKGDWIDVYTKEDIILKGPYAHILSKNRKYRDVVFDSTLIDLGIAVRLPKGFEALLVPRSSTFMKYGLLQSNNIEVIDNSFRGNDDKWMMPVIATRDVTIPMHTRICQFRVQLSQKATIWQKLRWLFSNGIRIKYVNDLSKNNRGGFGSTGL